MAMTVAQLTRSLLCGSQYFDLALLSGAGLFAEQHLRSRLAAASIIVSGVIAIAHGVTSPLPTLRQDSCRKRPLWHGAILHHLNRKLWPFLLDGLTRKIW